AQLWRMLGIPTFAADRASSYLARQSRGVQGIRESVKILRPTKRQPPSHLSQTGQPKRRIESAHLSNELPALFNSPRQYVTRPGDAQSGEIVRPRLQRIASRFHRIVTASAEKMGVGSRSMYLE